VRIDTEPIVHNVPREYGDEARQRDLMALQSQRRRMATHYCKRMPFSSRIEMDAPTYEEQMSASSSFVSSSGQSEQRVERNNDTPGQETANKQPKVDKVRKQPSVETRRRVGSVAGGEDAHSELVQSAVNGGMNDVTTSHLSDNNDDDEEALGDAMLAKAIADTDRDQRHMSCASCDSQDIDETFATEDESRIVVQQNVST
jgi:hypothetical protein